MDHNQAVKSEALEKYLAGELTPDLRDEFEEHYFSCGTCAAELKTAVAFASSVRQAFAQGFVPAPAWWTRILRPVVAVPVLASLLLAGGIGYRQLNTPRPTFSLIGVADTLGEDSHALRFAVAPGRAFDLQFDPPFQPGYSAYVVRQIDPSGAIRELRTLTPVEAGKTQTVTIKPSRLAGNYVLSVVGKPDDGSPAKELSHTQFTVEFSH